MSEATFIPSNSEKAKAWAVHAFTATGAVWGLLALFAAINLQWQMVFVWMVVGVFVDAVDGFFARRANVKKVLPEFDGALLDNVIDYFHLCAATRCNDLSTSDPDAKYWLGNCRSRHHGDDFRLSIL